MTLTNFTESVLRRDRTVVLVGLTAIVLLSWAYIIYLASDMSAMMGMGSDMSMSSEMSMGSEMSTGSEMGSEMSMGSEMGSEMSTGMEMAMPTIQPWTATDYGVMFVMWAVMMFAMMTPSAAPMILTYTHISRRQQKEVKPVWGTAVFYLGYLLIWAVFSAVATLAQGALHAATLLSPMMETTSPILGGIILVAAGVFQFTPLKYACLSHCRTPLGYFMTEWRDGKWGALVMGVRHGAYCVGCCWLLMALLFVAGVMNLFWIAVIAAYVLLEKVMPRGHKLSWGIGILMIGWGLWIIGGVLF